MHCTKIQVFVNRSIEEASVNLNKAELFEGSFLSGRESF